MLRKLFAVAAFASLLFAGEALAQTQVLDQTPAPSPSATVQSSGNSENYVQSYSITGGTLYQSWYKPAGSSSVQPGGMAFVPAGASSLARSLPLTDAKSDAGVSLTATATSGAMGVARTAGTSLDLVGEATSSNGKTDKAMFEITVPNTYVAGSAIPVTVYSNYTGSGTPTAASCTMTLNAYSESTSGGEASITVTNPGSQLITATNTGFAFSLAGTGLVPGQRITLEAVMLITTSAGALTGQVNSVVATM